MPKFSFRATTALRTGSDFPALSSINGHQHTLRLPPSLSRDGRSALRASAARLDGGLQPGWHPDETAGPLSRGRQHPSWPGRADGDAIRPARSAMPDCGFGFDQDIAAGGYAWWYVDGMSDDGLHAVTIIGFQGSVFSPYYAWSGRDKPLDHCSVNVALYGRGTFGQHKWAMTERGEHDIERTADRFTVGPSGLSWDGQVLTIDLDERTPPFPLPIVSPIKGKIRVHPKVFTARAYELDPAARHAWWPIAPLARIEVDLAEPSLRWSGDGYIDCNRGVEPLEAGFKQWDWSRAPLRRGAVVVYDVDSRHGPIEPLAIKFDHAGNAEPIDLPKSVRLPPTLWLVGRNTRADAGKSARVVKTLEDSPFYARSLVEAQVAGERVTAIHESLSLTRFASPIVKWMLPYKMPRKATLKP
jgi:carotenoid 1,2-hydratase